MGKWALNLTCFFYFFLHNLPNVLLKINLPFEPTISTKERRIRGWIYLETIPTQERQIVFWLGFAYFVVKIDKLWTNSLRMDDSTNHGICWIEWIIHVSRFCISKARVTINQSAKHHQSEVLFRLFYLNKRVPSSQAQSFMTIDLAGRWWKKNSPTWYSVVASSDSSLCRSQTTIASNKKKLQSKLIL